MIKGKYVKLRSLELNDLPKLRDWRNSKFVRKATREYRLLNMINQKKWFEMIQNENPPISLMFGVQNNKNKLIGVCGLTYIDWKNKHAEISCYLNSVNWQKTKEARDTIRTITKYGFEELNLHRVGLRVLRSNERGMRCYQKCGFKKEGILRSSIFKNNKFIDQQIMSILKKEYKK